jgi:hypothetical protein
MVDESHESTDGELHTLELVMHLSAGDAPARPRSEGDDDDDQ